MFNKQFGRFVFANIVGLSAIVGFILAYNGNVPGGRQVILYVAVSSLILYFMLWVINNLRYTAEWIEANHQEPTLKPKQRISLLALGVAPPVYAGILIAWYLVAFLL